MTGRVSLVAAEYLRRFLFGKPDGTFIRARCFVLGHDWMPCDPGCCNRWYCQRCAIFGPTLDAGFRPTRWFWKPLWNEDGRGGPSD